MTAYEQMEQHFQNAIKLAAQHRERWIEAERRASAAELELAREALRRRVWLEVYCAIALLGLAAGFLSGVWLHH